MLKEISLFMNVILLSFIHYQPQRSWGKVMLLHVSVILFTGCVVSQHALQVVSQHALQQVSGGYPSMPCRCPGPHAGGEQLRGLAGGSPGPHPREKLRGLAWRGLQAHTWDGLQAHIWGAHTPGGLQAHTRGGLQAHSQGGMSQHALRQTPPDSYCCGWYASYWNAFLFIHSFI